MMEMMDIAAEAAVVEAEVVEVAAEAEAVVEVAEAKCLINRKVMKKSIIHAIPFVISLRWIFINKDTLNPMDLLGPDFLKFYLMLIFGTYLSIFLLKLLKETISKITCAVIILIFLLGIIRLIRGFFLGRPVGYLVIILIMEFIVMAFFISPDVKDKIK